MLDQGEDMPGTLVAFPELCLSVSSEESLVLSESTSVAAAEPEPSRPTAMNCEATGEPQSSVISVQQQVVVRYSGAQGIPCTAPEKFPPCGLLDA